MFDPHRLVGVALSLLCATAPAWAQGKIDSSSRSATAASSPRIAATN